MLRSLRTPRGYRLKRIWVLCQDNENDHIGAESCVLQLRLRPTNQKWHRQYVKLMTMLRVQCGWRLVKRMLRCRRF